MTVHSFPSLNPSGRDAAPSRPEGRDRAELALAVGLIAALALQTVLLVAGWLAV